MKELDDKVSGMGQYFDKSAPGMHTTETVTNASGGVSAEAHEMGIQRMVQAGATPITWMVFASELQRDLPRTATGGAIGQLLVDAGALSEPRFSMSSSYSTPKLPPRAALQSKRQL